MLFDPVTLNPNPEVPKAVWDLLETLPSVTIPKRNVKPIERWDALSAALLKDGLIEGAVEKADKYLCKALDGRAPSMK